MANENGDNLIIEIELDDGKLAKGFVKAKDVAGREGQKSGKDFGDSAYSSATAGLNKLKSTILGIGTALAGAFAAREVINAAQVQENAVNQLNASLRNLGEYTPELSRELQDYASKLQSVTTFGDEAIINQMAFAQAMGASAQQSKEILKVSTDMAAALNIDLNSAVRNVTKTLGGYAGELGEVIPSLKGLSTEQLKAGEAIGLLGERFSGFASAQVNTFSGALAQLKNTFGDLLEAIGLQITQSPVAIATFRVLSNEISKVIKNITSLTKENSLNGFSSQAIEFARAVNTYLIAPLEMFYNIGKFVFDAIVLTLQTVVASVAMLFGKIAELAEYFGMENGLTTAMKDFAQSTSAVWDDMVVKSTESFNSIFDFPFAAKTDAVISEIEMVASKVAEANANALATSSQGMRTARAEVSKTAKDIAGMIQNGLVRSISTGIQAVGASFVQGGGAFKDFGNAIIGIMGDLAIQVGTAIIFTGQAIEVLRNSIATAVGVPAIAAGIALVALGGALKAFAAKNSSTAASNSAVPQTGGDSFGSNPQDQTVITNPETAEERNPVINVNIQGDVLDSEESGRRIVDIINNAFDREGVRIRRGAIV